MALSRRRGCVGRGGASAAARLTRAWSPPPQVFYLHPPQQPVQDGDVLRGKFEMQRRSENHRLMRVTFTYAHGREAAGGGLQLAPERTSTYNIE